MKCIYTQVDDVIYKINQSTELPNKVQMPLPNNLRTTWYPNHGALDAFADLSNIEMDKSNKELYSALEAKLISDKTTEIKDIQNRYKVAVDYCIIDKVSRKEMEHAVLINPLKVTDCITPLGVDEGNEVLYRRTKLFESTINFHIHRNVPYGIISTKEGKLEIKINDIIIYQDFSETDEVHNSIYSEPFNYTSNTISNSLSNMAAIYSSLKEGQEFAAFYSDINPRTVGLHVRVLLGNCVVVYDDATIDTILADNVKPPEEVVPEPITPDTDVLE